MGNPEVFYWTSGFFYACSSLNRNNEGKLVKIGKFYGIGVGPGDPGLLTLRAVEVLCQVQVVFAATGARSHDCVSGSVVNAVAGCKAERVTLVFSMARDMEDRRQAWSDNAKQVVDALQQGKDCAFVTIGDPLIYSTYTYLLRQVQELLPEVEVETIPGITSFQAVAARNNLPLVEDQATLGLIPAWTRESTRDPQFKNADTLVLLKTYHHRQEILARLRESGFVGECIYASRVGLDDEMMVSGIDAIAQVPETYLSLIIAKRKPER